ncbi:MULTISPECIES: bifunctional DNA primase/polymerase [Streptomyces]|uniref:Bifunctional DNA primase/polymerase n=1 Tax=Streptomyces lycii TaxID=2654337 RepID=A0ABQ7FB02_9ACTN|nr:MULTISPECIES: bifunctional DNA primase/polymerase [Streptomyces]KAF4405133.1 bifunctional DNA primase/polymerase [Streptomyces lycii]PGH48968.1 DNA primase [Streptomyces sp. Ru87]
MEETIRVNSTSDRIPRQRGEQLPDAAVRYAEERHWDVTPGSWLVTEDGTARCSCGDPACPAPGVHPAGPDWAARSSASPGEVRRLWQERPRAGILLPTGRDFDALDVPEGAGCLALARMERMELTPGPVISTPMRRMIFLVRPGASLKVPGMVRRLGWLPSSLGMVARGDGDWVVAPPTRFGAGGAAQWARRPTPENRWLPEAEELIAPLAYACARQPESGPGARPGAGSGTARARERGAPRRAPVRGR